MPDGRLTVGTKRPYAFSGTAHGKRGPCGAVDKRNRSRYFRVSELVRRVSAGKLRGGTDQTRDGPTASRGYHGKAQKTQKLRASPQPRTDQPLAGSRLYHRPSPK